jgi:predicted dehydrogenase
MTASPVSLPRTSDGPSWEVPRPLAPVNVAITGLGRTGLAQAAVLSAIPGCTLAAVVDPRPGARGQLRGLGYDAHGFGKLEKLLEAAKPHAVFVTGPQPARASLVRLALEAGTSVMVERPLAGSLAEAETLAAAAAKAGRRLAVGYDLVFHPVFRRAGELLADGILGSIYKARTSMFLSRVFSPRHPIHLARGPLGGGVVAHVASDLLFLLMRWLGAPVQVRATWSRLFGEVEDELHAMMKLKDGAEVGFECSWSVPGYPHAATVIELEGENGKLLISDDALEADLLGPRAGFDAGHTRLRGVELPQVAAFDWGGEALYLRDASFLAWVTGGPEPPNAIGPSLEVQRVIEALYRSAREQHEPVGLGGAST